MNEDKNRQYHSDMKEKIFDAFFSLVSEKDYIHIGIGDICGRAYISRPTFIDTS